MKRKILCSVIFIFVLFALLSIPSFAEEALAEISDEEWESFKEALPSEATKYFSDDALDGQDLFASGLEELLTPKGIITVVLELFGVEAVEIARLFFLLSFDLISSKFIYSSLHQILTLQQKYVKQNKKICLI